MSLKRNLDNLSGSVYVDQVADWDDILVGHSIVEADEKTGTLVLDDGARLVIDKENSDCCSWIELTTLRPTTNIITAVTVENTDDDEGEYDAWVTVLTEDGPVTIAEAKADASNGYYLHGFALAVKYVPAVSS